MALSLMKSSLLLNPVDKVLNIFLTDTCRIRYKMLELCQFPDQLEHQIDVCHRWRLIHLGRCSLEANLSAVSLV